MTETTLNRESQTPLHKQLRQILLGKIQQGDWKKGQVIPREYDLMAQFGLSRFTVRRALEDLTQAGYLIRTKKLGTVVSEPKVEQDLAHFYSFARDLSNKGLNPTSRVLKLEKIIPDEITAQLLGVEQAHKWVYHLERLRMVENGPLVLENSYLSLNSYVKLESYDWHLAPLYEVLEKEYNLQVLRAEEFLEPINLEESEAEILEVAPGAAAFRVERHTYNQENRIFERRISLIRGDRYRFHIDLPKLDLGT